MTTTRKGKLRTFKESYKHAAAVKVLADWLSDDYRVEVEKYLGSDLPFKPDIAVYTRERLDAIYEVVHKCAVDGKKLGKMQYFAYLQGIDFLCHEVSAEWILTQTEKPERILTEFTFEI